MDTISIPSPDPVLSDWFHREAGQWHDAVLPAYDGGSIANLPSSVLRSFNASEEQLDGLLPPVRPQIMPPSLLQGARVVFLIVIDGLGAHALSEAQARGDVPGLASADHEAAITSVFPATTAAATTSLQYGVGPGGHGMAGYTIYLQEIDRVFNMITWSVAGRKKESVDGPEPEKFLPGRNLYRRLASIGVDTVIVSDGAFETSPLTRAQAAGVRFRGYQTLSEFSYRLLREAERPGKRFVFGYWHGFDLLGHSRGTHTPVAELELRLIDLTLRDGFLEPLAALGENVAVVVTADHGHTAMPHASRLNLSNVSGFTRSLARRPTGEPRQLGLTFLPGRQLDPEKLTRRWKGKMVSLDMAEAIEAGLFGPAPHHPDLGNRTGEMLLLARGEAAFNFPGGVSGSLGGHGSLTPREMLVPLLGWRFRSR